jgi:hypothetical protein
LPKPALQCLRTVVRTFLLTFTVAALGQTPAVWFTIQGDSAYPAADTIEVNPVPVSVNGDMRTMQVRVSRSAQRTNWDGVAYRSFKADVLFDCVAKNARYIAMEYFMQPAWAGPSHALTNYTPGEGRPMRFRDVSPNPTAQIIRAVCAIGGVISN